jgi:hypothetical protein
MQLGTHFGEQKQLIPVLVSKNWIQTKTGFSEWELPIDICKRAVEFLTETTNWVPGVVFLVNRFVHRERERLNNCATNQPLCSLLGVNHCYLENLHARMYASKEDSVSSSALDHNAGAVTCVQAFVSGQEGHLVSVTKYWMQFL